MMYFKLFNDAEATEYITLIIIGLLIVNWGS